MLSGCSKSVRSWDPTELIGYQYVLDDRKVLQTFLFLADSNVIANIGETDGVMAFPLLKWEITTNGLLSILDGEEAAFSFSKISGNPEKVLVRSASGEKQVWLRSRAR